MRTFNSAFKMKNNAGLFISLLIHGAVFMMPVTFLSVRHFSEEIKLFVVDETPTETRTPFKKEQTAVKNTNLLSETIESPPNVEEKAVIQETKPEQPFIIEKKTESPLPAPATVSLAQNAANAETVNPKPIFVQQTFAQQTASGVQDVIFGGEHAPAYLHREIPQYPFIAKKLGKEGKVLLRLTIDEKGSLLTVEVLENAGYGFADAAVAAVKKSTFLPAIRNRTPIISRALLPVKFILRRTDD